MPKLAVREIIEKFVSVSLPAHSKLSEPDGSLSVDNESYSTCHADHLMEYACEVLSTGLLLMEFIDGIREGGGYRILHCWRAFLPIFKATNRKNYCVSSSSGLMKTTWYLPATYKLYGKHACDVRTYFGPKQYTVQNKSQSV